jgi:replicative DNA helicase
MKNLIEIRNVEVERYVISCFLQEPSLLSSYESVIDAECFSDGKLLDVFSGIKAVIHSSTKEDFINIAEWLQSSGKVINMGEMAELYSYAASTANVDEKIGILLDYRKRRILYKEGVRLAEAAGGNNFMEELEAIAMKVVEAIQDVDNILKEDVVSAREACDDLIQEISDVQEGKQVALKSDFQFIDVDEGGLRLGALSVLAARSGQGKSALAEQILINIAKNREAAAYISMEMPPKDIMKRAVSSESDITMRALFVERNPSIEQLKTECGRLGELPIYFPCVGKTMTIENITDGIRKSVRKYKAKIVVVDYLQRIVDNSHKNETNEQFIGRCVTTLKDLALVLNIHIMLLCQVNRSSVGEPDESMLRGSGQIMEGCDDLYILYQAKDNEKYSGEFANIDPNGTALVRNAKGRHTGKKARIIGFDGAHVRFYDLCSVPLLNKREDIDEDEKAPF